MHFRCMSGAFHRNPALVKWPGVDNKKMAGEVNFGRKKILPRSDLGCPAQRNASQVHFRCISGAYQVRFRGISGEFQGNLKLTMPRVEQRT